MVLCQTLRKRAKSRLLNEDARAGLPLVENHYAALQVNHRRRAR